MEPLPNKTIKIGFPDSEGKEQMTTFSYPNREPEGEATPEAIKAWEEMIDEGYFDGGTTASQFQTVFMTKLSKYSGGNFN
jgi:hypothetical protein